ncbi:MAG: hypothetical protein WDZ94_02430 [Patescibacteria group bacterium]
MSSPFPQINRALSPDEQSSSTQPVDIEPLQQPEQFEHDRMWRFMPQPPDKPGTDSSVADDPYTEPENSSQSQTTPQQSPATSQQPQTTSPQPQQPKPESAASEQTNPAQPSAATAKQPGSQQDSQAETQAQQSNPTQKPENQQSQSDQPPTQEQPQNQPPQSDTADPAMTDEEAAAMLPNYKPQKEEVLFEWQSPSRPFKKHSRQYYSTIMVIASLISVILLFASQFVFVAVIVALVFLYYVLMTTPPSNITQQLTTYGIRVENNLYYWEELGRFWFTKKHGQDILHVEVARFPNQLSMLLGELKKDDMDDVLSEVLLHEQPPPTTYEKAAGWLHRQIPLDLE